MNERMNYITYKLTTWSLAFWMPNLAGVFFSFPSLTADPYHTVIYYTILGKGDAPDLTSNLPSRLLPGQSTPTREGVSQSIKNPGQSSKKEGADKIIYTSSTYKSCFIQAEKISSGIQ